MKLQVKLNLFLLSILCVLTCSVILAGTLIINEIVYDLNRRLLLLEISNLTNKIEHSYSVLQRAGVPEVESYVRKTQQELVELFKRYTFGKTGNLYVVARPDSVVFHKDFAANDNY